MTAEERIAQLEGEVRSLRLIAEGQAVALRAANLRLQQEGERAIGPARRGRPTKVYFARGPTGNIKIGISVNPWARAKDLSTGAGGGAVVILAAVDGSPEDERRLHAQFAATRLVGEWFSPSAELLSFISSFSVAATEPATTPPLPPSSSSFPSSFPPSSEPPSSYPLSFPPSSPTLTPVSLPPASRSAPEQRDLLPGEKPTKAKKPKAEPTGDPRHAPLVKALTDAGWPFDGPKDAAHVKALLAVADQQETTRGELAGVEILRRARIAWDQFPGFYSARTISGLRSKWGEFASPDTGKTTGPPNLTRGSVRAELMDHTKPQEPF